MDSPDVDYHIDEEIKTVVPVTNIPALLPAIEKPAEAIKPLSETSSNTLTIKESSSMAASSTTGIANTLSQSKDIKDSNQPNIVAKPEKDVVQKNTKTKETPIVAQNSKSKNDSITTKDTNTKNSNYSEQKNKKETKQEISKAQEEKVQKGKDALKAQNKPIKIYSFYKFITNLPIVKKWSEGIPSNIDNVIALIKNVMVYWNENPNKLNADSENSEENEDSTSENEDESEEEEEEEQQEEEETDYSKYAPIIAQASELQKSKKWNEIQDLFAENPEASESPDAQIYLLEAEINAVKPNYNQVRRYASNIIEETPENPLANYGMALYHFNSKKPNLDKANESIKIALKAKTPPDGASALANKITIKRFLIPAIVVILLIIVGLVFLIKKIKNKKKESKDNTTSINSEDSKNEKDQNQNETASTESPFEKPKENDSNTKDHNEKDSAEKTSQKPIEKILSKIKPLKEKTIGIISNLKNKFAKKKSDSDKVVLPNESESETNSTLTMNQDKEEIIEEIIEEIVEEEELPQEEVIEEIIEEELIEDQPVIQQNNTEPNNDVVEEIVEEIIEEEQDNDISSTETEEIIEEIIEEEV